jgi:Fe-S oxidoreductase
MADNEKPDDGKAPFDFGAHYSVVKTIGELMRDPGHRPWLTTVPEDRQDVENVVWLGCNIIRVGHLAQLLEDVLTYLKLDFVMMGGPSVCCGIVHAKNAAPHMGKKMLKATVGKLDAFKPQQLLCWCPACDNRLHNDEEDLDSDSVRGRKGVAAFIAAKLLQLDRSTFKPVNPIRLAIHSHGDFAEQRRDDTGIRDALALIPGVELLPTDPMTGIGNHCSETSIEKFGESAYRHALQAWIRDVKAQGATHVGTLYHSCHRQLLGMQRELPAEERLPVLNYLSILAASLGLAEREDKFARFMESGEIDAIIAELEPNVDALKLPADRVRRAVVAHFGRSA